MQKAAGPKEGIATFSECMLMLRAAFDVCGSSVDHHRFEFSWNV